MRLVLTGILIAGCGFEHGRVTSDGGPPDTPGQDGIDGPSAKSTSPRRIVFDNSASTRAFSNFPVLVPLDATSIDYDVVTNPATHLRFTDAAGTTDLPFEVDTWNPAGESLVWVRVPTIAAGSTTDSIFMHFGPTALGLENPALTWLGYDIVNHLHTGFANSAGTAYAGTPTNVTTGKGTLGEAATFTGTGDSSLVFQSSGAVFSGISQFTLMFWLYADYDDIAMISGEPKAIDKGGPLSLGRLFVTAGATPELVFQIDLHFTGSNNNVYLNTTVVPKTWTFITYTFDSQQVRMYKDGVQTGVDPLGGGNQTTIIDTGANDVLLGHGSNPLKGMIDELRIEPSNRTADWVAAHYRSMSRKFVTITDP